MYKDRRIAVVVPAYDEEELILDTLSGMPEYVDRVFTINDGSADNTLRLIQERSKTDSRIVLINHDTRRGLGQSLIDGYVASAESDADITVIMAGDNQMNPRDLPRMLDKVIDEKYDYVKGNRLLHRDARTVMPKHRYLGNAVLTILSKFATGYFSLMDPQCGYTAIRNDALRQIPISNMTKGYGYNADILCMLNIQGFRVTDVEVQPVYGREKSKIVLATYIRKTSWLLVRLFFRRLWERYIIRDFHPLVLFYLFAFFNVVFLVLPLLLRLMVLYSSTGNAPRTTLMILTFAFLISFQSVLFALWMDMDYNKER